MERLLISAFFLLISLAAPAQEPAPQRPKCTAEDYIREHAGLAIQEMDYAGIPASITLAQGILESGCGNSRLSYEGNNHFGIKCKDIWTGDTLMVIDDDYNDRHELVASCFRVYPSTEASYRDHSDFLRGNVRYASLFELDPMDSHAWAEGLQRCGYATSPQYANVLNSLIERYALDVFDQIPRNEIADCMAYYETRRYTDRHRMESEATLAAAERPRAIRLPQFYKAGWLKANRRQAMITGLIEQATASRSTDELVTASADEGFLGFEVTTRSK